MELSSLPRYAQEKWSELSLLDDTMTSYLYSSWVRRDVTEAVRPQREFLVVLQEASITLLVKEPGQEDELRTLWPPNSVARLLAAMDVHGDIRDASNNRILMRDEVLAAGKYVLRVRASGGIPC